MPPQVVAGGERRGGAEPEVFAGRGAQQCPYDRGGQVGHQQGEQAGDALLRDGRVRAQIVAEEQAGFGVPEPGHQGGGEGAGASAVRSRVLTECQGDGGQGVFGRDEEGVETGVLHDERVRCAGIGVAVVTVVGCQPYVAAVVQVGGPVGRVAVREVGPAEGGGGCRIDPLQRPVPAGAVVHARFPRVQYGREPVAAEVPVRVQIAVPGGEPG